jgi:regulator of protease activity HflC (stomatin/prohibitin superfamily)
MLVLTAGAALALALVWLAGLDGSAFLPLAALLLLAGPLAGTRAAVARRGGGGAWLGRFAQAGLVAPACAASVWLAWRAAHAAPPAQPLVTAAIAAVAAFGLLVGERHLAAARFAEAPALRRIAAVSVATAAGAALVGVAQAVAMPLTQAATGLLAAVAGVTAAELALRALLLLYLPPPRAEATTGAAGSIAARAIAIGLRTERAGPVLREQLGLDFTRSWALAYLRAAALPLGIVLLLCGWGLSGVKLIPMDGRAVYERFGAPVAVLHPGLHAILPWPLGRARPVEFGTLHETALGEAPATASRARAEDIDPTEANRLWDQPHPGELTLIIASNAATAAPNTQLFQSVAADLRVVWRIGLSDRDARRATYAASDPAALLRATAGEVVAGSFAGRTLDAVLGADREAMGARMRAALQDALDAHRAGLEIVAVVIEAIHPPAGAADAYHAVRAAEIMANAAIFAERGRALTIRAQSRQFEFEQVASSTARAAELVGDADRIALRFDADRDAQRIAGADFIYERTLASLTQALAHAPLTIIDSRLWTGGAPTLDMRPMPSATPTTGDGE